MSGTPYVSSGMLLAQPAGLSWQVVPTLTAPGAENTAQLDAVCRTATATVDTYCRQPLRAVTVSEEFTGPGHGRVITDRDSGITTLVCRRRFITDVTAVQTSPAAGFPPQWTLVPAGQFRPKYPVLQSAAPSLATGPMGGNAIAVAPGNVTDRNGRGWWRVLASYTAGWPHAGLTGDGADEGGTTFTVDDVTGWAGWSGFIYDGQFTEPVTVVSAVAASPVQLPGAAGTVQAGPGTLTLSSPLASAHDTGTVVSAMPADVIHAAALAAAVQALETIDAIAVQSLNGQSASIGALAEQSELLLDDFRCWS